MTDLTYRCTRPGGRHLGGSPRPSHPDLPAPTRPERQGAPASAATAPRSHGRPGPRSTRPEASPHRTPVPTLAHPTPRAIRVHWSPR